MSFVKNNLVISLIGGVFISCEPLEYLIKELLVPTKQEAISLINVK